MENSDDWYTPPEIFQTMGITFDLDVCAPKGGIKWIPATNHYSIEDDALIQTWSGRVWMNPPFSGPAKFIGKWLEHGNGCALVPLSKSRWFGTLWASNASIVVPDNPAVSFYRNGVRKQIFIAVGFAAIGPQENHDAIARLGVVR